LFGQLGSIQRKIADHSVIERRAMGLKFGQKVYL